jgi:hypothetical protein
VLFGFNDNSVRVGLLSPDQAARLTRRAGGKVTRLGMDWRFVEPRRDEYVFDVYDGIYDALRRRGVRPLWTVLYAPPWAREPGVACPRQDCRVPPAPEAEREWEELLALVTRRYPRSAGIELWNEPNLTTFWQPTPEPERYARLLRRGYRAVKRADNRMKVVLGGLSNRQTSDAGNVSLREFLERVYDAGAKGRMDALSFHPYPASRTDPVMVESVLQVLEAREQARDTATPLWVTEIGATTTGTDSELRFTEKQQAETLVDAYERLRRVPGVEVFIVHTLIDPIEAPDNPEAGYGVLRADGTPRPVLCALAKRVGGKGIRC